MSCSFTRIAWSKSEASSWICLCYSSSSSTFYLYSSFLYSSLAACSSLSSLSFSDKVSSDHYLKALPVFCLIQYCNVLFKNRLLVLNSLRASSHVKNPLASDEWMNLDMKLAIILCPCVCSFDSRWCCVLSFTCIWRFNAAIWASWSFCLLDNSWIFSL